MASLAKLTASKASNYYYEEDPIFSNKDENGQDQNLQWQGKLAQELGLTGAVNKADFENLLNAKDQNGEPLRDLSLNNNDKRIDAYDITFAAPKSVSMLALGGENDEAIINAHQQAVNKAMSFLEDNFANYKVGQERELVNSGKLIYAQAQHSTARAVGNEAPDMHLHTHNVIMNIVQTNDGEYRALAAQEMMQNLSTATEIYKSELAAALTEQGYQLEDKSHGFDIKMEQDLIDTFSNRNQQITQNVLEIFEREKGAEAVNNAVNSVLEFNGVESVNDLKADEFLKDVANELGVKFEKTTEYLAQHSYKQDKEEYKAENLKEEWQDKLAANGKTFEMLKNEAKTDILDQKFENAKEVLNTAATLLAENDATFKEKDVLNTATKLSYGQFTYNDLKEELSNVKKIGQKSDNEIKRINEDTYTTQGVHKTEKENEKMLKEAKNEKGQALMSEKEAKDALKDFEEKNFKLTEGQYNAAYTVLTSKDSVITVQGVAGSGKTTSLKAINHALDYKEKQADITLLAPTNKAAQGAIEESKLDNGKAFKGQTTAKFINDFNKEKNTKDEAIIKDKEAYVSTGNKHAQLNKFAALTGGKVTKKLQNGRISAITKGENKGTVIKEQWGKNTYNKTIKDKEGNTYTTQIKSVGKINRSDFKTAVGSLIGSQVHSKKEIINTNSFGEKKTQKETTVLATTFKSENAKDRFGNVTSKKSIDIAHVAKAEKSVHAKNTKEGGLNLTITTKRGVMGITSITQKEVLTNKKGEVTALRTTNVLKIGNKEIKKSVEVHNAKDSATVLKTKDGKTLTYNNVDKLKAKDLADKNLQPQKIMIVDEASMLSAKDGNNLLKAREQVGGKVIMFGDSKQLQSIGAGDFFNQAKQHSKTVNMEQSLRQQTSVQKEVAKNIRDKETVSKSFNELKNNGKLHEIENKKDRITLLAKEATKEAKYTYTNVKGEQKEKTINYKNNLVVANTNKENKQINQAIRNELKAQGKLQNGVKTTVLVPQNISKKDAMFAHNFKQGQTITAFKVDKLKNGQQYNIEHVDKAKNELYLKNEKDNSIVKLDLQNDLKNGNIQVFNKEEREFAKGDIVVVTKTDKSQNLLNSDRGEVINIENNKMTVDFGSKQVQIDLNKENGIDHGYSMTTHKSQGMSVDRVQMHIDTESSSNSLNATHVALTRQKIDLSVYTDNAEKAEGVSKKEQEANTTLSFKNEENKEENKERMDPDKTEEKQDKTEEKINTENAEKGLTKEPQQEQEQEGIKR